MLNRYILLCKMNEPPKEDVDQINRMKDIRIIEHDMPKLILVEASEDQIATLRRILTNWVIDKEREYPAPKPPYPEIEE